jgi:signal transduction histidine kinase
MADATGSAILVVDDQEVNRYSKGRVLRRAGFEVLEAGDGATALRLVEEHQPRLVVLDVHLPDIDGWEVCRRIKSDPATGSILVLQVSATYVSDADTVRALEGGADACLTEPIEPPVLVATVRALLRARRAEDALRDALGREQAARAAAEVANRAKDDFLATLSHELRSPLTTILSWVTLLRGGRLDRERSTRALEAIERNTRLQVSLIEDLLDVSRIVTGKMRLEIALVQLGPLVEAAIEGVRAAADAKGILLDADLDPTLSPLPADAARLQQVLWNLLSNAIKFTPRGGRVEVRAESLDSVVQITVRDNGMGVDPAFLPHLFERFRQEDSSSTRSESGLGLGLAIVRHLVELHGGTVEAQSAGAGQGTAFTVRLPLPAVRMSLGRGESRESQGTRLPIVVLPPLADVHVLVVDDDADARQAVAIVLEQCQARVTTASSVREAMGALAAETPDVIVSDVAMPQEDGFTFIRRVRGSGVPGASDVPAIALTAYAAPEDQRRLVEAGYQTALTKPVDPAELAIAVSRLGSRAARS